MHETLAALTSWRPGSTRPSRPVRMKPSGYRRPTDDPHLPRRAHPRRRNAPSGAACDVAKNVARKSAGITHELPSDDPRTRAPETKFLQMHTKCRVR